MLRAVSPIPVLLGLLISSIAIKITTYLLPREVEMDFPLLHVDDRVGGMKERSP
jgi:hypothetical protein